MDQLGGMFSERALTLAERPFLVGVQKFGNGMFVSVSEGSPRIGSMTVSLVSQSGAAPVTTTIIPPPNSSLAFFIRMAAEQVSSRASGIAVVSVYVKGELDMPVTKALLGAIMEMVKYDDKKDESARS